MPKAVKEKTTAAKGGDVVCAVVWSQGPSLH